MGIDTYGFWPDVIAGRVSGEFYAVYSQVLHRVILGDAGFTVVVNRDFRNLQLPYVTHPVITDAGLLLASGQVLDPETLEDRPNYAPGTGYPPRTTVASFPELNLTVFANEFYHLITYDAVRRVEVARRLLNASAQGRAIDRLVRYGIQGLAVLSWDERRLVLVDEAPRTPALADLAVGIRVPAQVMRAPEPNRFVQIDATLSVTNRGPGVVLKPGIVFESPAGLSLRSVDGETSVTTVAVRVRFAIWFRSWLRGNRWS